MNVRQENPKHRQGDGAGFGRLRAEQHKRSEFQRLLRRSHPLGEIYIDKVYEYVGVQLAFYRRSVETWQEARVAAFGNESGEWSLLKDMIVAQERS